MTEEDHYRQWDAAYVLGALSAAERLEFEGHLAGCAACREAIADLAVVPGLLARVPAEEALASAAGRGADAPQPPASLMPDLGSAGRHRWSPTSRHTPWYAVAAAAAALLVGGAGGWALHGDPTPRPPAVAAASRLAFSSVVPSNMTAVVDVVSSSTGTEFRVECQYARVSTGQGEANGAWDTYAIYVIDRSGHAVLGKTWTAAPDKVMHPSASSPLAISQISAVEIRAVDTGQTLMRARVG